MSIRVLNSKININDKEGICTCTLTTDLGFDIIGIAKCAPIDMDFFNQYTGSYIAQSRAYLKLEKIRLSYDKVRLQELIKLENQVKKKYKKTYEMICGERQKTEDKIKERKKYLQSFEKDLKIYLDEKNHMYETLRKARKENLKNEK